MDSGGTPQGIGRGHTSDQSLDRGVDGWAACRRASGEHGPVAAKAAALPAQHGRGSDDDEGLPPRRPRPGQPDPQEAIAPSKSWPIRRSLVDGHLLPQGKVLKGELTVAAAQKREEPEEVEQDGDHRAGFSPDQSRLINYLAEDGVLAKDRLSCTVCGSKRSL